MYLATAGENVCFYRTDNYELHQKYKPRSNDKKALVRDLSWSYDGRCFGIVVDGLSTVEIFRVKDEVRLYETISTVNPTSIAFSKHGNGLVGIGNKNGVVSASNYLNKNASKEFPSCSSKITALDFSSTDSAIAAGTCEGKTYIYGIKSGKKIGMFELRCNQVVSSVKFHHHRKGILAVGCHDGSVTVWDVNIGHIEGQYFCHRAPCTGLVFSPINTTFMASIGFDAAVCCFDIKSKKIILNADIPEAGSSIDMHKDGTTMAVGTTRGSVYVFDMRNMRIPVTHFVTLSGHVNKVAFQPPLLGGGRKSIGAHRSSLTGRLFQRVGSPSMERTGSTASSPDDLFSPLAQDPDMFSLLQSSYQWAPDSSLASRTLESTTQVIKSPVVDANENSINARTFATSMSAISPGGDKAEGFALPYDSTSNNLPILYLDARQRLSFEELYAPLSHVGDSQTKKMIGSCHTECAEPTSDEKFSRDLESVDLSRSTNPKLLEMSSFDGVHEDCNGEGLNYLSVPAKQSDHNYLREALLRNTLRKSESPLSTLKHNLTERLLDLSLLSAKKEVPYKDTVDDQQRNANLLSFLQPLNSTLDLTQDNMDMCDENKTLRMCDGASIQNTVDSKNLTTEVACFGDSVLEDSAVDGCQSEHNSQMELNDMFDKYSPSRELKDGMNFSLTFESSVGEDVKLEKDSPLKPVSLNESSKEVLSVNPLLNGLGETACLGPESSIENQLSMKEYIDEMFKDLSVSLRRQMFVMHTFNISSHVKQEMILNQILSELKKEKVDKSVGTDGAFY